MKHLLELRGLTKRFPRRRIGNDSARGFVAVRSVDLDIPEGSIYGLVGESGCGKTTLARTLLQLEAPSEGSVRFDGTELTTLGRREMMRFRRRMQIIFQDPNGALDPHASVGRSLEEGLRNLGRPTAEIRRIVGEVSSSVGIPASHLGRKPREFSGGQQQRLVIARALTMEPQFLVLDEPVSNLDVSVQAQIINLLVDLKARRDLTYLFISHDLNLVSYLCDYIAVMFGGRIIETGTAEQIIREPLHFYTRTLFASFARIVDRRREPIGPADPVRPTVTSAGVVADSRAPVTGCAFLASCDRKSSRCLSGEPPFVTFGPHRGVACFEARGKRS